MRIVFIYVILIELAVLPRDFSKCNIYASNLSYVDLRRVVLPFSLKEVNLTGAVLPNDISKDDLRRRGAFFQDDFKHFKDGSNTSFLSF